MPLFFLLSGFSLTVCYGTNRQTYSDDLNQINLINQTDQTEDPMPKDKTNAFYQNRFARVYPG